MSRINGDKGKGDHQEINQGMKGVHGVRVQVFMDKSQELGFFLCVLQYPYYSSLPSWLSSSPSRLSFTKPSQLLLEYKLFPRWPHAPRRIQDVLGPLS